MIQSTDAVYELFFDKLESDDEFFQYYGVDEEEALQLAKERAKSYLNSAIAELSRRVELQVDMTFGIDEETGEEVFAEEITEGEADVLTELMVLTYYERGLAKLRPKINTFSASELKLLHSPANERTSYVEMLRQFREHCRIVVSRYGSRDRLTGTRLPVDHTLPEIEEGDT